MVWATGAGLSLVLLTAVLLLVVVLVNGLGVFWPAAVAQITLADGSGLLGQQFESAVNPDNGVRQIKFKAANREFDAGRQDFRWIVDDTIAETTFPSDVIVLERTGNGDFYGYLRELKTPVLGGPQEGELPSRLSAALKALRTEQAAKLRDITPQLDGLRVRLDRTKASMAKAEYRKKEAQAAGAADSETLARLDSQLAQLRAEEAEVSRETGRLVTQQQEFETDVRKNVALFEDGQGQTRTIVLADIVRFYQPNAMGVFSKIGHYLAKVWELLTTNPRESNTEGGLFPQILCTVLLVFLMALSCFPLGVLAGIYLGEYAREGTLVRIVRIAVNNLAGIPSIVYGMFGLGFFIYGMGGFLDRWLYPEYANVEPVLGKGGVLWASLTLGLLTVPVVIVATEEALRTIPRSVRESSYALGATKFQTLARALMPLASPGIMTGFILAMARAAGEVAPLMITGAAKSANSLPLDGTFPYVHLDRQFMHLGFHIYDIGFQSPNVEATKPMVYVTTLLLVLIVLVMSSVAIYLRNRMRKKLQIKTI
jgi:phosphate transport system permease protein